MKNIEKESGCLILAGGQGTRLGCQGAKGCVELPVKPPKSLFQILLEKVKNPHAHIAMMTSPENHQQTQNYMDRQGWFGLKNINLFTQETINGIPNGNGKAFRSFFRSGLYAKWVEKGIKYLQVLPIDNPLAELFDHEMLNFNQGNELVLRGVKRINSKEKIGVIIEGETLKVIEYTQGEFCDLNLLGNTGLFSCTMDYVKRVYNTEIPFSIVKKKTKNGWVSKKEYFIFDLFPFAKTYKVLFSEREKVFSPVKNSCGLNSLDTAAKAFMTLNQ